MTPLDGDPKKSVTSQGPTTWVTLREASVETGVSVSALRQWQRRDKIRSRLDTETDGRRRLVVLEDVLARVERSRAPKIAPSEPAAEIAPSEPAAEVAPSEPAAEVAPSEPAAEVAPSEPAAEVAPSEPASGDRPASPGTVLLPLDAWERVLAQLGKVHQLGKELAVARERAARAETERDFLRDRLRESEPRLDRLRDRVKAAEAKLRARKQKDSTAAGQRDAEESSAHDVAIEWRNEPAVPTSEPSLRWPWRRRR